jgi:hypothetical protein
MGLRREQSKLRAVPHRRMKEETRVIGKPLPTVVASDSSSR